MPLAKPDFSNTDLWEIHEAVIFDEHDEFDEDGNVVARFTKADLERIARNQNERAKQSLYCPITIGHTRRGKPELEQPPIVGYALKYQVVYSPDLRRHCIKCFYYLKKDRAKLAKEFPRTSVEYWRSEEEPGKDFFDPIALSIQTPGRDIPPWTYTDHPGYTCTRYSMAEKTMADPEKLKTPESPPEAKVPHKPEGGESPKEEGEEHRHEGDPTSPPDAAHPEPHFHEQFLKSVHHAFPHLHAMHAKHVKEMEGGGHEGMDPDKPQPHIPPGEAEPEKYAAALSATNGAMPAPMKPQIPHQEHSVHHQRSAVEKLDPATEKRIKFLEERLAKADAESNRIAKLYQREQRQKELVALKSKSGLVFDVEEELADIDDMGPEQYQRHLKRLERLAQYQLDPTVGEPLQIEDANEADFGKSHLEKAREYIRAHPGCDWSEAELHARKR